MKTLHVLIATSDRAAANRVEAILRDVCFERVHVECQHSAQIADVEEHARLGWNELTIIAPDHLLNASRPRATRSTMAESLRLIRHLGQRHLKPIVAFGVQEEDEAAVEAAGVDAVLGPILDGKTFRRELERVLRLPARVVEQAAPRRWQLLASFLGIQPTRGAA